jgi:hypothetical protein
MSQIWLPNTTLDLIVAVPSGEMWYAEFGMCLARLALDLMSAPVPPWPRTGLRVFNKRGSILPQLRQQVVEQCLQAGATHILFIDSDQTFPPNTARRLLAWRKPVVACNVAVKRFPCVPTARDKDPANPKGKVVYTWKGDTGLRQVWRIGCGVMLIAAYVFKELPKPWFPIKWRPEGGDFQGEDWGFCEVLESRDIPIYIDQGLSWEIGHVGPQCYDHALVLTAEEKKEEEVWRGQLQEPAGGGPSRLVVPVPA